MILEAIYLNVLKGDLIEVSEGVQHALQAGYDPGVILNQGLIAAMTEIGRRFEQNDCFVPEMMVAARAMQQGLALLKPHLVTAGTRPLGKVVLGTVRGDLHDLGKRLVGMMLEGAGFEIIDLGVDIEPVEFVAAVRRHRPDLIGLSALLTTTMASIPATLEALTEAGLRAKVKVMVGGAPLTQEFCNRVGADLYAPDAAAAASRAKALLEAGLDKRQA